MRYKRQRKAEEIDAEKLAEQTETIIEKYCREQGLTLAQRIDEKMALCIKPKPKWCPRWLYQEIIKESVEVVEERS